MNKNRLDKIERALKPDTRNYHLFAIEYPAFPEKSTYTLWDGIHGSGGKRITREEFEELAKKLETSTTRIVRVNPVTRIVDDIPKGVEA